MAKCVCVCVCKKRGSAVWIRVRCKGRMNVLAYMLYSCTGCSKFFLMTIKVAFLSSSFDASVQKYCAEPFFFWLKSEYHSNITKRHAAHHTTTQSMHAANQKRSSRVQRWNARNENETWLRLESSVWHYSSYHLN